MGSITMNERESVSAPHAAFDPKWGFAWDVLTQHAGCGVAIVDRRGLVRFANDAAKSLLFDATNVVDRALDASMPPARVADCLSHVQHVSRTGEVREVSTMVRGRLVRTTYVRTPDDGGELVALIIKPGSIPRESMPSDEVVRIHSQHQDAGRLGKLSKRELEVLRLIAAGMPSKVIAQHLGRTVKTVEAHRASLGRKLGVINRVQLARIAIDAGLVTTVSGDHGEPLA